MVSELTCQGRKKKSQRTTLATSCSLVESVEYESKEVIPSPQNKPNGEDGDDPDYDLRVNAELLGPHIEPQEVLIIDPNEDVEQQPYNVE